MMPSGGSIFDGYREPDYERAYRQRAEKAERELRDAERMFAALVWSMPDHRATLWPVHLTARLTLHREDSPTDGSVVFRASEPPA